MLNRLYFIATWPIRKIFIFLIISIRPLLGPANCRFEPTCGKYAIIQLKTQPLHTATYNITKQLISCCNPFSR
ncbi:membrane protein insertion efficiency factor YidD [bacterium]|nr:membrane protein insertion efficiency factor YidD [bacterium]